MGTSGEGVYKRKEGMKLGTRRIKQREKGARGIKIRNK
jgi:hypothetical protein